MAEFIVTKKTMERLGSSVSESRSAPVSAMARKAMERMGWSEGSGLGKNSDGMKEHIKTKKRADEAGLGTEKAAAENGPEEIWWLNSIGAGLKALNKKKDKKKDKKDKKNKKEGRKSKKRARSNSDSDDGNEPSMADLFAATGGARLGMRARADQKGKLLRVEKADYDTNASAALMAQIISEPQSEAEEEKDKKEKREKREKKEKKEKREKKEKKC
eukprot:GSChrysophyteH2.ASY1.ANO1.265.1 assembled CDS